MKIKIFKEYSKGVKKPWYIGFVIDRPEKIKSQLCTFFVLAFILRVFINIYLFIQLFGLRYMYKIQGKIKTIKEKNKYYKDF